MPVKFENTLSTCNACSVNSPCSDKTPEFCIALITGSRRSTEDILISAERLAMIKIGNLDFEP